jgi:hypothetical protein
MEVAEHVMEQLRGQIQEGWPGLRRPVFLVDGTSLQLPHEGELVQAYPLGRNQHGEHHWPVLKVGVFHDVYSGLALPPTWGPMYGPNAVSEQELALQGLDRLPADAVVLADGNFGIFHFAYSVVSSGRGILARLTRERAIRILERRPVGEGMEVNVVWTPSPQERRTHPDLPEGAQLGGRIIVFRHPEQRSELIYLFTRLALPAEEEKELYRLRWNIETDLRALKRTVAIHQLSGESVEVVGKELLLAVTAYNLVRTLMSVAAQKRGLSPRELSFSGALTVLQAWLPKLARAGSEMEREAILDRMLDHAARLKLPKRSQRRSFRREVWGQGGKFPPHQRKAAEKEASQ